MNDLHAAPQELPSLTGIGDQPRRRILAVWIVVSLLFPVVASADFAGFDLYQITGNSIDPYGNPVDMTGWFSVVVSDTPTVAGADISLTFMNNWAQGLSSPYDYPVGAPSPDGYLGSDSEIQEIYVLDGDYFALDPGTGETWYASNGGFSPPAAPGHIPGFDATGWSLALSGESGGIGAGQSLEIGLQLLAGVDYADVVAGFASENIIAGIHVTSLPGLERDGSWTNTGASDAFVTPVPGAALLGFLGLGVAGMKLRRMV